MARVCGFSLGQDEVSRIANISLIQAKEDAFIALQKTKQKIESSYVIPNDTIIRVPLEIESSLDLSLPVLELMGVVLIQRIIYLIEIKDEDSVLEY